MPCLQHKFQAMDQGIRDERGLLKSVKHEFDERTGFVNWRKMINPKHLAPNDKNFPGISREDLAKMDVLQIPDDKLIIKLQGIREVAMIRGFRQVRHHVCSQDRLYCAVSTTILFIGNFETGMGDVEFSALADAHPDNTSELGRNHLMAIAENKGFVRAVRGFLGIPILGADEVGRKGIEAEASPVLAETIDPVGILDSLLRERGYSFEDLKLKLVKNQERYPGAEGYQSVADIPKDKVLGIIEAIKKAKPRTEK